MADQDDAYQQNLELAFNYDRAFRSQIIYEATALEGQIESIIAWHFCPDEEKHLSFIALLFNRAEVPFSKKIEVLEAILKRSYPDLLEALPGLINKLNSVRRLRNKFAHSELILDEERVKEVQKGIYLRRIDREGKVIEEFIGADETDKKITTANCLGFFVFYVYCEIQNRAKSGELGKSSGFLQALKSKYPEVFQEEAKATPNQTI